MSQVKRLALVAPRVVTCRLHGLGVFSVKVYCADPGELVKIVTLSVRSSSS